GAAGAQDDPTATLRDLLARGFYNAAAQLEGPRVVEAAPDDPAAHLLYARAARLTGDVATARAAFDEAVALRAAAGVAEDAALLHERGLLLAAEGDADAALAALEAAFAQSDAYGHAMDLARVAWRAGRSDAAREAYARAAETERGAREPWPHLNRGRILAREGATDAALEAFAVAVARAEAEGRTSLGAPSPALVEAHYRIGTLLQARGEVGRAEAAYRTARSLDPNYPPAVQALDALARRGDERPPDPE
ncbi:MAG: tetratricopeptide repeat protein, partial [Trueperaceae bacterium]|nr:tetratricopeptide repeat protein [Trueperaceae bacterium]